MNYLEWYPILLKKYLRYMHIIFWHHDCSSCICSTKRKFYLRWWKKRKKERIPEKRTKITSLLNNILSIVLTCKALRTSKKIANCLAWHVPMLVWLPRYHAMTSMIQVGPTTKYIFATAFKRFLSSCFCLFGWMDPCEKTPKQIFHEKQRKKTKFNICSWNY